MAAALPAGGGCVVRAGREFLALRHASDGVQFDQAFSPSVRMEDLRVTARALADEFLRPGQAAAAGADGDASGPWSWIAVGAASETEEGEHAAGFAEVGGVSVECLPMERFSGDDGERLSALPGLARGLSPRRSINTAPEKLAWLPEAFAAPILAMMAVLTVALTGVGLYAHSAAEAQATTVRALVADVREKQSRLDQVQLAGRHAELQGRLAFMDTLQRGQRFNPPALLRLLREARDVAAGAGPITIQRVLLDSEDDGAYALFVDGRDQSSRYAATRRFLAALQRAGWRAESLDPVISEVGSFSYRLWPVEVQP